MAMKREQSALVARHEIISLAGFTHGQQKIIVRIERSFHARQRADVLGESFNLVHQAAGLIGLDKVSDSRFLQRGSQLVELFRAAQESKVTVFPAL
jgi:hypothetical protein